MRTTLIALLLTLAAGLSAQSVIPKTGTPGPGSGTSQTCPYLTESGSIPAGYQNLASPTIVSDAANPMGDDDMTAEIYPTGFDFPFFTVHYNSFRITSDGYIILGAPGLTGYSVSPTPKSYVGPGRYIAPCWCNMNPSGNNGLGTIGWQFTDNTLYVEWKNMEVDGTGMGVTCTVALRCLTGAIEFHYGYVAGGLANYHDWQNYTAAQISDTIQPNGSYKSSVAYMSPYITSSGALLSYPMDHWVRFKPNYGGLEVWEAPSSSAGTNVVENRSAASGLRDFGNVAPGSLSAWTYMICKRPSGDPFQVDPPTLTGANTADFELYLPSPWQNTPTLQTNDCWFAVRFRPQSPGVKTAKVKFTHTAPNTMSAFEFEVRGASQSSTPWLHVVDQSGGTIVNGSAAVGPLDFGVLSLSAAPQRTTVQISNLGQGTLTLGSPQITGVPQFTLDTTGMQTALDNGEVTSFDVVVDPAVIGPYNAVVSFTHNDTGTTTPFSFSVKADVQLKIPVLKVTLQTSSGTPVQAGAAPAGPTDFGQVDVGAGGSLPLEVYVTNAGWQDLVVSAPVLQGADVADFGIDTSSMIFTLATHARTSFTLWFDPRAKGPKLVTVSLTHNDTNQPTPFTFDLAGLGVDPNGVTITSAANLPAAATDTQYSQTLQATGGALPYSWSLVSGSLPAGMTLDPNGLLSGMAPSTGGTFQFTVLVTDALGGTDTLAASLTVSPHGGRIDPYGAGSVAKDAGCAAVAGTNLLWPLLLFLVLLTVALRRRTA